MQRGKVPVTIKLMPTLYPKKGFTLIELMVVIAIISVLAVMGFATFRGLTPRGNDAKRRADIDAINKAFEANYNATSFTPYGAPSASWSVKRRA